LKAAGVLIKAMLWKNCDAYPFKKTA